MASGFHFIEDVVPTADDSKTGSLVTMAVIETLRQPGAPVLIGA